MKKSEQEIERHLKESALHGYNGDCPPTIDNVDRLTDEYKELVSACDIKRLDRFQKTDTKMFVTSSCQSDTIYFEMTITYLKKKTWEGKEFCSYGLVHLSEKPDSEFITSPFPRTYQ